MVYSLGSRPKKTLVKLIISEKKEVKKNREAFMKTLLIRSKWLIIVFYKECQKTFHHAKINKLITTIHKVLMPNFMNNSTAASTDE